MSRITNAALAYVLPVFALAFGIGALRVTLVAPITGAFWAVALEIPLVLGSAWIAAGLVLRRWPLPIASRAAMGATAFALLMLLELATALAFGQTPLQFLSAMTTAPGLLGLAGQIGFGLLPALRVQPRG